MKKILYPLIGAMIVVMVGLAGLVLFSVLGFGGGDEAASLAAAEPFFEEYDHEPVWLEVVHHEDGIYRISAGTVITYQYYDPASSEFETIEEHASALLIGLSRSELATMFADWRIISFNPYHVRLQQNAILSHRQFIITAHEGFIAVFYDEENGGLKELTARPIAALPESEQARLIEGIKVTGNEELLRALEDFGS